MINQLILSGLPWIKIPHLNSFGLTNDMLISFVIIIGVVGAYFIIRPIISFLIALHAKKLLTYLLSSLFFVVLFFIVILVNGNITNKTYEFFSFSLQVLSILGGVLLLVHLMQWMIRNIKMKKNV